MLFYFTALRSFLPPRLFLPPPLLLCPAPLARKGMAERERAREQDPPTFD